jgi:hypothetical protein
MVSIFNDDIYKIIISFSSVSMMKSLSLVNKSFYDICFDKHMWSNIFKDKNLEIWNNDIKNVYDYVKEYDKMSYAKQTSKEFYYTYKNSHSHFDDRVIFSGENIDMYYNLRKREINIFPDYVKDYYDILDNINLKIDHINFAFRYDKSINRWYTMLTCKHINLSNLHITEDDMRMCFLKIIYYISDDVFVPCLEII